MIARQFTITYEDGTTAEVASKQFDLVKLERHFGKPVPLLLGQGGEDNAMRFEAFFYLAYCAAVRGRETPPEFDVWAETVADLEVEMDEDEDEDVDAPLDRTP